MPLREQLLSAHRDIEAELSAILALVDTADRARRWAAFCATLLAHLALEEAHLFPALQRSSERDARVLAHEHRHLRTRLAELGTARELADAKSFAAELHAHATSEDRLLYQRVEDEMGDDERADLMSALAAEGPGAEAPGAE